MKIVLRRVLWRLAAGIGVLWSSATLCFVMINVTGGDSAIAILGGSNALPTPAVLARVRAEYNLDRPLYQQYLLYLGKIVRGDLGDSYRLRIPVTRAISQQLGSTVVLALLAGGTAILASLFIALLTAHRVRWVGSVASGTELVASSVPGFVLGIALLLLFSFRLHWLPASGEYGWKSLVLPTFTLAVPIVAVLSQVLRNELEGILEQPFITTARARGLSEIGVRFGHALRHALISYLTLSGFIFASLFGGAAIAETLFARQGVGRLMVEASSNKDVPLVLGITMLAAATNTVVNLVVDLLYVAVDPRVTTA